MSKVVEMWVGDYDFINKVERPLYIWGQQPAGFKVFSAFICTYDKGWFKNSPREYRVIYQFFSRDPALRQPYDLEYEAIREWKKK